MGFLRTHCLTIARFALAAWVGGAALFVINGVRLVTFGVFESTARDHMALIRFPAYYLFGFCLVGTSLLCLLIGRRFVWRWVAVGLVTAALAVMAYDYVGVYLPLERMISPPGQSRPAEFIRLHQLSKNINIVHVGLCLVAALVVCRPESCGHVNAETES